MLWGGNVHLILACYEGKVNIGLMCEEGTVKPVLKVECTFKHFVKNYRYIFKQSCSLSHFKTDINQHRLIVQSTKIVNYYMYK